MTQFPDHPFWDYSLDVYMQDKVGAACIDLQERYQLDVNVLLFCLWFGASDRGRLERRICSFCWTFPSIGIMPSFENCVRSE